MRPRLLFFSGLLLLAAPARAQPFAGALLIGGSVTNLSGNAAASFEPRAGLAGGVALGFALGRSLAIQPEALYFIKGAYTDAQIDEVDVRARFDLTYLEVPLLLVYRFADRTRIQPKVFAGPSVAFKLDARVRFRARDGGPTQTEEDDSIEGLDYGAVAGAGAEFTLGGQRLTLDARVLLGRANVRMVDPALRNVGVAVFLGVVF